MTHRAKTSMFFAQSVILPAFLDVKIGKILNCFNTPSECHGNANAVIRDRFRRTAKLFAALRQLTSYRKPSKCDNRLTDETRRA
jgi:hypothetical protein